MSHPWWPESSVFVLFADQRTACMWWRVLCGQIVHRWSEATEKSGSCLCCICLACMQWPAHTEVWIFGFLTDWSTGRTFIVGTTDPGDVNFLHLAIKIKFLFPCQKLEFGDVYATEVCGWICHDQRKVCLVIAPHRMTSLFRHCGGPCSLHLQSDWVGYMWREVIGKRK